jgi:hypothetical protein
MTIVMYIRLLNESDEVNVTNLNGHVSHNTEVFSMCCQKAGECYVGKCSGRARDQSLRLNVNDQRVLDFY